MEGFRPGGHGGDTQGGGRGAGQNFQVAMQGGQNFQAGMQGMQGAGGFQPGLFPGSQGNFDQFNQQTGGGLYGGQDSGIGFQHQFPANVGSHGSFHQNFQNQGQVHNFRGFQQGTGSSAAPSAQGQGGGRYQGPHGGAGGFDPGYGGGDRGWQRVHRGRNRDRGQGRPLLGKGNFAPSGQQGRGHGGQLPGTAGVQGTRVPPSQGLTQGIMRAAQMAPGVTPNSYAAEIIPSASGMVNSVGGTTALNGTGAVEAEGKGDQTAQDYDKAKGKQVVSTNNEGKAAKIEGLLPSMLR
ncbi:hypothetical protein PR202_gb12848 [Eleusine coracana subsp. coracana]|uniref:Uncharacterized protein n=1 Tax=Eleusine coracana subsp. coracana TaxID=191504 RepID=A0AAV5ENT6_ELECO|nr:hypothetical protein PR202_gb12848 [Eleusine coracana subsp. coracana]